MKNTEKEFDCAIYFNSNSWQLSEYQIQEILNKIALHKKLNQVENKREIKEKRLKI